MTMQTERETMACRFSRTILMKQFSRTYTWCPAVSSSSSRHRHLGHRHWDESMATDSEAIVKAERLHPLTIKQLQQSTITHVREKCRHTFYCFIESNEKL